MKAQKKMVIHYSFSHQWKRTKILNSAERAKNETKSYIHIHLHLQGANLWYTRELVGEEPNVDNQRY